MAPLVITTNSSQMLHPMNPNNQQIKTATGNSIWKPRSRSRRIPPSQINNVVLKAAALKKSPTRPASSTSGSKMIVPQPKSISYLHADILLQKTQKPKRNPGKVPQINHEQIDKEINKNTNPVSDPQTSSKDAHKSQPHIQKRGDQLGRTHQY